MTTAAPGPRASGLAPGVRGAALAVLGVAAVASGTAAVLSGAASVLGALAGAGMVLFFFGFGALTVNTVAGILPGASLLVALLTYTLQVVLLGLVFLVLTGTGATDGPIDRTWLGLTAIVASLAWVLMQTLGSVRARQPLYDIPRGSGHPA